MIDSVDEHGYTERIGQQNEFLARVGAYMTGIGEKPDTPFPFGFGRFHFANEGVQVAHKCFTHLSHTWIPSLRNALQHDVSNIRFIEFAHRWLPPHRYLECGRYPHHHHRDVAFQSLVS